MGGCFVVEKEIVAALETTFDLSTGHGNVGSLLDYPTPEQLVIGCAFGSIVVFFVSNSHTFPPWTDNRLVC